MKRRTVSAAVIAALLAVGIAGVLGYRATSTLTRSQPMDEVEFDLASIPGEIVLPGSPGLEIISGNVAPDSAPSSEQSTAGVKTRAGGTEIAV